MRGVASRPPLKQGQKRLKIRGVHHIAIKTRQLGPLESFYHHVLGLEEVTRHHDEAGLRSIWFETGEGVILMVEREEQQLVGMADPRGMAEPHGGFAVVAFTIEASARTTWRSWLESKGHPIVRETRYTLYVDDPDGNLIGLSSWPNEAESQP